MTTASPLALGARAALVGVATLALITTGCTTTLPIKDGELPSVLERYRAGTLVLEDEDAQPERLRRTAIWYDGGITGD